MDTISAITKKYIPYEFFINNPFWSKPYKHKKHGLIFYCSIDNVKLTYFTKYGLLKFECSITKVLYGCNTSVFHYNDLNLFYTIINNIVRIATKKHSIHSICNWTITRLDLVSNFQVSPKDKEVYIDMLNKLHYSRCTKKTFSTSVHAHNKSTTFNFYDKDSKENGKIIKNKNILRLEIQFKNSSLYRYFGKNKKVDDVLGNPSKLNEIYKNKLDALNLTIPSKSLNTTINKVKTLYANKKIGTKLYENLCNYIKNGKDSVSDTTNYRYQKILKDNKINSTYLKDNVSKHLDFSNFQLFSFCEKSSCLDFFVILSFLKVLIIILNDFSIFNFIITIIDTYITEQINIYFFDDS